MTLRNAAIWVVVGVLAIGLYGMLNHTGRGGVSASDITYSQLLQILSFLVSFLSASAAAACSFAHRSSDSDLGSDVAFASLTFPAIISRLRCGFRIGAWPSEFSDGGEPKPSQAIGVPGVGA